MYFNRIYMHTTAQALAKLIATTRRGTIPNSEVHAWFMIATGLICMLVTRVREQILLLLTVLSLDVSLSSLNGIN